MSKKFHLSEQQIITIVGTRYLTAQEYIKYADRFPKNCFELEDFNSSTPYCWNRFCGLEISVSYFGAVKPNNTLGATHSTRFSPVIEFNAEPKLQNGSWINIKDVSFYVFDENLAIYADRPKLCGLQDKAEIYEKSRLKYVLERWTERLYDDNDEMPTNTEITQMYFEPTFAEPLFVDSRNFEQSDVPYIEIDNYNTLVKYIPAFGEEEVILPEGIESIRNEAFSLTPENKVPIKSIHLPRSLKFIEEGTFWDMYQLETITVHPENIAFKTIDGVLYGCAPLNCDEWLLNNTDNLKPEALICYPPAKKDKSEYVLPYGISSIVRGAFSNCQLESIIIDSKNENKNFHIMLGDFAFRHCGKLKTIHLLNRKNIIVIGYHHFDGCNMNLQVNHNKKANFLIDRGLISKDKKRIYYCSYNSNGEWYVPDGIEEIGDYTNLNLNCNSPEIRKVFFPKSFLNLRDWAFAYNNSIEEVYFEDNTKYIGQNAFVSCVKLNRLSGKGLEVLAAYSLNGCSNLKTLVLGPNCEFDSYGWPDTVVIEAPIGSKTIENAKIKGIKYKEI